MLVFLIHIRDNAGLLGKDSGYFWYVIYYYCIGNLSSIEENLVFAFATKEWVHFLQFLVDIDKIY